MVESDVITKDYTGKFEFGVDEKRRVQIPAKWRPQAEGVEFAVIVWPKDKEGPCLRVLPPNRFAKLRADLDAMPVGDAKTTLKRFIGANTEHCALDKAGRICLPDQMMEAVGLKIKEEAVLVGVVDQFEIWNPKKYAELHAVVQVKAEDAFKLLE
jgi:MraZ protein